MSIPITKESWKSQYLQLKAHHEKETKWMRELIVRLELKLEECEMKRIKDTGKTLPKIDHEKVAKALGATLVSKEAARAETRRRFQKICDSLPEMTTSVFAQAHPYIDVDSQDDEYFTKTINDIQEYIGISNIEFARDIRVSTPTLERWKAGKSRPHKLARRSIFQYLDKRTLEAYLEREED